MVAWAGSAHCVIGAIAGWIAEKVTRSNMGLIMNVIVGIVGAYIGAFLSNAAGLQLGEIFQGWFWGNLVVAAVGAILLLLCGQADVWQEVTTMVSTFWTQRAKPSRGILKR